MGWIFVIILGFRSNHKREAARGGAALLSGKLRRVEVGGEFMASVLDEGVAYAFIFPGSTVEILGGGGLGKFLYDPQRHV